jgi:ABC-type nitrate/sulfonate/bicarbonate transport system ATPase subunit
MRDRDARVETRALQKSFATRDGPLEVLRRIDLCVRAGEFVSIIGPSGSGKSTLFNILIGMTPPTAGDALVDGQPVRGRHGLVAFMPQRDLLFPWRRLLDNTTLGLEVRGVPAKEARRRALDLFPEFGLAGFEKAWPYELSGGMRQRAALLRTVVQGQDILLLDEPLGALDSLTRTEMQEWLAGVWERFRWTVLLITHDIREAVFLSDRVYVFSPRPGTVRLTLDVPLPRPRPLDLITTPEFAALEAKLLMALRGAE